MIDPGRRPPPGVPRRPSPWRAFKAVAWSFLGVRRNSQYREDLSRVNPLHVIAVGLIAIALLVGGLIALVHWIVAR